MSEKRVSCDCGATFRDPSDDALVRAVQEHAKQVHDMELDRDQVLSMAEVVPTES